MLTKSPTQTKAWSELSAHFAQNKDLQMKSLFAEDTERFNKFSIQWGDILVDYSKNRITQQTLDLLFQLAKEAGLNEAIEAMFTGGIYKFY